MKLKFSHCTVFWVAEHLVDIMESAEHSIATYESLFGNANVDTIDQILQIIAGEENRLGKYDVATGVD